MPANLMLVKGQGNTLMPMTAADFETVQKIKIGRPVAASITQPRNPVFHRRFFALLNLAFDYWEPEVQEWKGIKAEKSFEVFREQVTILAGYREVTYNLDGSVKVTAKSISFGRMEEQEFQKLYKAVFNVLWRMVLSKTDMNEPQIETILAQMLEFDS